MKKARILILIGVFVLILGNLFAQTRKETFESYWEGRSESVTDQTDSGYIVCEEYMYSIYFDEDTDTFTGIIKTVFHADGEAYECRCSVSGSYDEDTKQIIIRHESTLYAETLPYDMYWEESDLYLYVYFNDECDGYFYLMGQSSTQSLEDEFYILSNCPY